MYFFCHGHNLDISLSSLLSYYKAGSHHGYLAEHSSNRFCHMCFFCGGACLTTLMCTERSTMKFPLSPIVGRKGKELLIGSSAPRPLFSFSCFIGRTAAARSGLVRANGLNSTPHHASFFHVDPRRRCTQQLADITRQSRSPTTPFFLPSLPSPCPTGSQDIFTQLPL